MKTSTLIKQSLTYYARTNLAVILGVATAVAVLAGALLTGDSVRASLKDLFLSRLGNSDCASVRERGGPGHLLLSRRNGGTTTISQYG